MNSLLYSSYHSLFSPFFTFSHHFLSPSPFLFFLPLIFLLFFFTFCLLFTFRSHFLFFLLHFFPPFFLFHFLYFSSAFNCSFLLFLFLTFLFFPFFFTFSLHHLLPFLCPFLSSSFRFISFSFLFLPPPFLFFTPYFLTCIISSPVIFFLLILNLTIIHSHCSASIKSQIYLTKATKHKVMEYNKKTVTYKYSTDVVSYIINTRTPASPTHPTQQ